MNQRSFWGESDDEPLPDWMDPVKCKIANEQKELQRKNGNSLNEAILNALNKPAVPLIIKEPDSNVN